MSLLTSLVTQIAQNAIQSKMQGQTQMPTNMSQGGLGGGLGGMFGGSRTGQQDGFGLDDVLGGLMRGGMGSSMNSGLGGSLGGSMGGGMLGQVLGSVLGGGMGGGLGGALGNNMGSSGVSRSGFGGKGMLMAALLPVVLMFIQRNGGLSGALDKIRNMGFGQQANSWMSTDQNEFIDAGNIAQLFDQQDIDQVAQQTGADTHEIQQGLAELLPQVMDNLTPNGNLDTDGEANNEINEILSQLSQFQRQ